MGFGLQYPSLKPLDRDQMEDYFQRDKADFAAVTKYFTESGYLYINIVESDLKKVSCLREPKHAIKKSRRKR